MPLFAFLLLLAAPPDDAADQLARDLKKMVDIFAIADRAMAQMEIYAIRKSSALSSNRTWGNGIIRRQSPPERSPAYTYVPDPPQRFGNARLAPANAN